MVLEKTKKEVSHSENKKLTQKSSFNDLLGQPQRIYGLFFEINKVICAMVKGNEDFLR